jgi:UDP-2-acetamido-2,6-beta-L-arabino-hexul-4-ose reductase
MNPNMKKIKVGITGQPGFVGTHLFNYLNLFKNDFEIVPCQDSFFSSDALLDEFVTSCDTIVHLAAMNRHGDPNVIYSTNIKLVSQLIASIQKSGKEIHVIFSSSTQESLNNLYGQSKLKGRELFIEWANTTKGIFTGLVIPNVFGPFGVPFYNSVVSTFSYQIINNLQPKIDVDNKLELIYVGELVAEIVQAIRARISNYELRIEPRYSAKVTEILDILKSFTEDYIVKDTIPNISEPFYVHLFNTLRSYLPVDHFPRKLKVNTDNRGYLFEFLRSRNLGQGYFSLTKPGITRGNHYHTRKIERFCVVSGEAVIKLRKIGATEVIQYNVNGEEPCFIDMPIYYTHNITNTGQGELCTIFWANEFFNSDDPDTFFEEV